jgi:hypothetical protein
MSDSLREVLQREAGRFPELWNLVRQLEEWIRSCERLRTEVEELLRGVVSVDPSGTILVASGKGKVFVKAIELNLSWHLLEATLTVEYESGNSLTSYEDLRGDFLVSFLTRFEDSVEKTVRDALADLKRCHRELEELKRQILRDYPKEILMNRL